MMNKTAYHNRTRFRVRNHPTEGGAPALWLVVRPSYSLPKLILGLFVAESLLLVQVSYFAGGVRIPWAIPGKVAGP